MTSYSTADLHADVRVSADSPSPGTVLLGVDLLGRQPTSEGIAASGATGRCHGRQQMWIM